MGKRAAIDISYLFDHYPLQNDISPHLGIGGTRLLLTTRPRLLPTALLSIMWKRCARPIHRRSPPHSRWKSPILPAQRRRAAPRPRRSRGVNGCLYLSNGWSTYWKREMLTPSIAFCSGALCSGLWPHFGKPKASLDGDFTIAQADRLYMMPENRAS